MPESSERQNQEQAVQHHASVNQHRDEPMPASHHAGDDQPAAVQQDEQSAPGRAEPGQAVRDMMGGPSPQGDVPDAPATQIAAADNEKDQGPRVRHVANAVPGKPDGEVDTRS
jgi:hypothetical protein